MTAMHHGLIEYHQDPAPPGTASCHRGVRANGDRRVGVMPSLSLVEGDLG